MTKPLNYTVGARRISRVSKVCLKKIITILIYSPAGTLTFLSVMAYQIEWDFMNFEGIGLNAFS